MCNIWRRSVWRIGLAISQHCQESIDFPLHFHFESRHVQPSLFKKARCNYSRNSDLMNCKGILNFECLHSQFHLQFITAAVWWRQFVTFYLDLVILSLMPRWLSWLERRSHSTVGKSGGREFDPHPGHFLLFAVPCLTDKFFISADVFAHRARNATCTRSQIRYEVMPRIASDL